LALEVAGGGQLQGADSVLVRVLHINRPPIGSAYGDQNVKEGDLVTLDCSNSAAPYGTGNRATLRSW